MKCPHCQSEQAPTERGPYLTVHAGMAIFLACPECDAFLCSLPVPQTSPTGDDLSQAA